MKVRYLKLALVSEEAADTSLPMPTELDWKRELRRRRSQRLSAEQRLRLGCAGRISDRPAVFPRERNFSRCSFIRAAIQGE